MIKENITRTASERLHSQGWDELKNQMGDLEKLPRIKIANKWITKFRPGKILDIGCGPGHLADVIKKSLIQTEVHGLDFSKSATEFAKESLDCFWRLNIDLEDIPVENNQYDAIICLEVLEHVYDVTRVLREIHRLLKPSAKALISVPNLAYWRYRTQLLRGVLPHPEVFNPEHIRAFTLGSLKNKLIAAHLDAECWWGYGERLRLFAKRFPSLFSSTLFVQCSKSIK